MRTGNEQEVIAYPSPDELWNLTYSVSTVMEAVSEWESSYNIKIDC